MGKIACGDVFNRNPQNGLEPNYRGRNKNG